MSTFEILIIIFSSSVVSAALTSVVNWKLHNSNYKKEYYKKILEKRLSAFEKVQEVTAKLGFKVQLDDSVIPSICFNDEYYQGFIYLLGSTIDSSFWLDNSTSLKLTELNVYLLNNFSNNIDANSDTETKNIEYQKLGKNHTEKIREFREELNILMSDELKKLHKIDNFLRNHKNKMSLQKSFEVYRSKYK
jgi:hypothetical protein